MRFLTHSPEETEALGEALGRRLRGGEIVAYYGDLGAGKAAFTRGLARGLDISARVTSPTYTIVNEYLGGRLSAERREIPVEGNTDYENLSF